MQRGQPRNRRLDRWLGTPLLNLLATFHRRRIPPAAIRRIGVMCSPALGDTLLFSAPLQDIRAAFPSATLIHICMKQNLAAAEIIPGADERIVISLTRPGQTIHTLRALQLDILLDFTSWQRLTAFYTLMSGAKFTAGFATGGQQRSRGYDRVVEHTGSRHEVDNLRALVAGCGLDIAATHQPAVRIAALDHMPFPDEADIVALHPWASGQRFWLREWPQDRWVTLAARLAHPETLFLITGAPDDLPRIRVLVNVLRAANLRAEAFVSPDGFRTLTAVLQRARLVVSVNTGVMHLAAILGAPTISLNGPTAAHRWGARGRCCANVQPADGSGGYLHLGFEFDGQPEDVMQRISVDQVMAAAESLSNCGPAVNHAPTFAEAGR